MRQEKTPPLTPLRFLTYNIHKGIGGIDRSYRPERIAAVIEHYNPDIAFLQEVDEGVPRSRGHRQVDWLGEALGYSHRCFYPNVKLRRGHYGNAILSRFAIDHEENIDLTLPFKKGRSALHARLTIDRTRLWLFNVHLGLARYERHRQVRQVQDWMHQHRVSHDTAVVLGGDFNDVYGRLGQLLSPDPFDHVGHSQSTFPAARPLRALDRVFVRGPAKFTHSFVGRTKMAKEASDHLPLIADIELGAPR